MKRRTFIAAAAAAPVILPRTVFGANNRLNIAFIGMGIAFLDFTAVIFFFIIFVAAAFRIDLGLFGLQLYGLGTRALSLWGMAKWSVCWRSIIVLCFFT
mgnify:CR=1 FL=1